MEELGKPTFEGMRNTIRRKRSQTSRRPKPEESTLSSTPPSDDVSKVSSDENIGGDINSRRKEFSLNQCVLRDSSGIGDEIGVDNRFKNVKLKVGGVTRTIQATYNALGASGSESSLRSSRNSDASRSRHKLSHQEESDGDYSPLDKKTGLRGIPWKDFTVSSSSGAKEDFTMGKISEKNGSDSIRKSKRKPKKCVLDAASDDDEDAEIKYLEKLKNAKVAILNRNLEEESSKRKIRISGLSNKSNRDEISDDTDYDILDKDSVDLTTEIKSEPALTARQRARLSGKDASSGSTGIEFPNGLPPAPPRKQKEKLTEVQLQLKKAEAAQKRKLQVEKAARESEAEAIRKILGQESSRKKREDKNKKRLEELEQEKAAKALELASNTVRWVMSPTGTVVTFPKEMGLPSIFNPSTRSYPPPREKCAGPSCNNPYKYRDSKTKVPLCSLQCYKAVQATKNSTQISPMP